MTAANRKDGRKPNWKVVQEVTAKLHNSPYVQVEEPGFLTPTDTLGANGERREIDVLITTKFTGASGRPEQFTIECKDWKIPVHVGAVESFIGKLHTLGLPLDHGIFVSTSGYTAGAMFAAKKANLQTCSLKDVTLERFGKFIRDAVQSTVYLLPVLGNLKFDSDEYLPIDTAQLSVFRDVDGNTCGYLQDLMWKVWDAGQIPNSVGQNLVPLTVPLGWRSVVNDKEIHLDNILVVINVHGMIVDIEGEAKDYILIDTTSNLVLNSTTHATFEMGSGSYPVQRFETEEGLEAHLLGGGVYRETVGRLRLPRMLIGSSYWPPSEHAIRRAEELKREYDAGRYPHPPPFKFEDIEGSNLATVWEPIARSQGMG